MSAGAVGMLAPEPARMPSRVTGPPLRLVGSDERGRPDERGCPNESFLASAPPAIRLTRRGRLVLTLLAMVSVAALAVVLAASVDAAAPAIDHATTVSTGQTLSELAAVQLPGLPIPDAVARIQLANGLSTSQVQAGQVLLIPVAP